MRVGRNDPCHCGSGKKYKKCCLSKDEAARPAFEPAPGSKELVQDTVAETREAISSEPKAARPLTPQEQAREDLWTAIELADFDGRTALVERAMAEPDILDADLALDIFLDVRGNAHTAEQRRRVSALVDRLREQLPAAYEKGEATYVRWRITEALNEGRDGEAVALGIRMGELAHQDIDDFNLVYDQLAWHGRLDALAGALRVGWPRVRESHEIVPWGVDAFADKGAHGVMFEWLERHPEAREVDAELREAVSFFLPELARPLDAVMARLAGWAQGTWGVSDFQFRADPPNTSGKRPRRPIDDDDDDPAGPTDELPEGDPDERRLWDLGLEFIHYARNQEGIPFTKGWLFEGNITAYLLQRQAGELEARESMWSAMQRPSRKPAPRRKPPAPEHILCPDAKSLERFLADHVNMWGYRPYQAAVTLELLPAWLRFLESRGLLDAAQHARTLDGLRELPGLLRKLLEEHEDPALARSIEPWPPAPHKPSQRGA